MDIDRTFNFSWGLIALCCIVALATAYIAEYCFHIIPCPLCLYHRYAYYTIALFAFLTLFLANKTPMAWGVVISCLGGIGISMYHIAIENHWFDLKAACANDAVTGNSIEEVKRALLNNSAVSCTKKSWEFLGISFTIYSGLLFLGLFGLASTTLYIQSKIRHLDGSK